MCLPRGALVPDALVKVCSALVGTTAIEAHWDSLIHLAASVMSGHASAVTVMHASAPPLAATRSTMLAYS